MKNNLRERVLKALEVVGCCTAAELREFLNEQGEPISERWIRSILGELVDSGQVKREGSGRKGNAHTYALNDCGTTETLISEHFRNNQEHPETAEDYCGSPLSLKVEQFRNNPESGGEYSPAFTPAPPPEPAPEPTPSRRPTCPQCGGIYVGRESGGKLWCYTCRRHHLLNGGVQA